MPDMYSGANAVARSSLPEPGAPQRQALIEEVLSELEMAVSNLFGIAAELREYADRTLGPVPPSSPPHANGRATEPSSRGEHLRMRVVQLHAAVDELRTQYQRIRSI